MGVVGSIGLSDSSAAQVVSRRLVKGAPDSQLRALAKPGRARLSFKNGRGLNGYDIPGESEVSKNDGTWSKLYSYSWVYRHSESSLYWYLDPYLDNLTNSAQWPPQGPHQWVITTATEPAISTPDLQIPMLLPTLDLPYINPKGAPKAPLKGTPTSL